MILIPWKEGGGNITVTPSGNSILISSDINSSVERSQILTFRTNVGKATAQLKVVQKGDRLVLRDVDGLILRDNTQKILTAKIK